MQTGAFVNNASYIGTGHADSVSLIPRKKKVSQLGLFRTRSYSMSTGLLPFSAILGKQSTISHAFPFWLSSGATTETGTALLKEPHPPTRC